ncbi:unnamed protein product [Parajaminaea phylloscopi]
MAVQKRKRCGAADENEAHYAARDEVREVSGNQTLPVAELPADFDGVPLDGSTYLAMVRQEAASHPSIFLAAHNPYQASPPDDVNLEDTGRPDVSALGEGRDSIRHSQLGLPSEQWRTIFMDRFRALREALSLTPATPFGGSPVGRLPKASFTDSGNSAWFRFIFRQQRTASTREVLIGDEEGGDTEGPNAGGHGADESLLGPVDVEFDAPSHRPPIYPTPVIMAKFTNKQILSLLSHLPYWITLPLPAERAVPLTSEQSDALGPAMPPILSQWCFAAMAKLDRWLVSDEISILRTLARASIASIALRRRRVLASYPGASPSMVIDQKAESGAWTVVAIVAGLWGQNDLWEAAEQDLATIPGS